MYFDSNLKLILYDGMKFSISLKNTGMEIEFISV